MKLTPSLTCAAIALLCSPAMAGEPIQLDPGQLDRVTAGLADIAVLPPNSHPPLDNQSPPVLVRRFVGEPSQPHETYVVPGAGANVTTPSGTHGAIPPPD